jgi:hypothetical protein
MGVPVTLARENEDKQEGESIRGRKEIVRNR